MNATLGFARLAERTGIPEKSLMRMLGPAGNPRAAHLATIIGAISEHEGVEITARITDPVGERRSSDRSSERRPPAGIARERETAPAARRPANSWFTTEP